MFGYQKIFVFWMFKAEKGIKLQTKMHLSRRSKIFTIWKGDFGVIYNKNLLRNGENKIFRKKLCERTSNSIGDRILPTL